jgi:hypothetical protein
MTQNDDNTVLFTLGDQRPYTFWGYSELWVANNGNITLGDSWGGYNPRYGNYDPAAIWAGGADLDSRDDPEGLAHVVWGYGIVSGKQAFVAEWHDMGDYNRDYVGFRRTMQLILWQDEKFEVNIEKLEESENNGAFIGYVYRPIDVPDGQPVTGWYQVPGSGYDADLEQGGISDATTHNLNSSVQGRYAFGNAYPFETGSGIGGGGSGPPTVPADVYAPNMRVGFGRPSR